MFHNVTHANVRDMYDKGLLEKGSLIKSKFSRATIFEYGLDTDDNEWRVGILSHIVTTNSVATECIIEFSDEEPYEIVFFDFYVYSDIGMECLSLEGNDIMIYIPQKK